MGQTRNAQSAADELERNRALFARLEDDHKRDALYAQLRDKDYPVLRCKSLLGPERDGWPLDDLYLLSSPDDVRYALQHCSVKPYGQIRHAERFMLGLDAGDPHRQQNDAALTALKFNKDEIDASIAEAWRLAAILALKNHEFDVAELAEQVALRFAELLFGLAPEAHVYLQRLMAGSYRRLTFQIIGRHFVGDSGLPHEDDPRAKQAVNEVEREIREAAKRAAPPPASRKKGEPAHTVIATLHARYGEAGIDDTVIVARGLIAGTIGNVRAAVTTAIDAFLSHRNGRRSGDAQRLARYKPDGQDKQKDDANRQGLSALIEEALLRYPPAPFLARRAQRRCQLKFEGQPIPEGATLLLLMGAKPTPALLFGGSGNGYLHRCVGEHLARPLIEGIVSEVLRLPGLEQVLDPGTGEPRRPKKLWGAICESYPLQYARARRLVQQPLYVVLPIREPVRENAERLKMLTAGGACIVEDELNGSRHVHFAWFNIVEGGTHLAMSTVYDGDFDAYVEYFATRVALFDRQFKYLAVDQEFPISAYPKQFVDNIRKYNRTPLAGYFYSAYPEKTVADIDNSGGGATP